mgnify:CR=1 FL=1
MPQTSLMTSHTIRRSTAVAAVLVLAGAVGAASAGAAPFRGTYAVRSVVLTYNSAVETPAAVLPGIRFAILGRTDDMLTVKGINVYPQAVAQTIFRFVPRVTGAFRILLERPGPLVRPPLRIRLEHAGQPPGDLAQLERELAELFGESLRIRPAFEWVAPGTIPRETGKTRHVEIGAQ